jgi:hypothetical protein
MLAARVFCQLLGITGSDRRLHEEAGIFQRNVQSNLASGPRDPTGSTEY